MDTKGVADALYAWAKGFDQSLRLNTVSQDVGDRALITSQAVKTVDYIDGRKDVRLDFAFVLVEPWSEGVDTLNEDALLMGEEWLAWVDAQTDIPGFPGDVLELEPDDLEPYTVMVTADAQSAKYQFQAHVIYRI